VFDDVGERLGDDEVAGVVDVCGQPLARDVKVDGEIQSRDERVHAGA
jgi:hypothetical protein